MAQQFYIVSRRENACCDLKRIKPRTEQLKAFAQDIIDLSRKEIGSLSSEELEEMRKRWRKRKPNKGAENIERFNRNSAI